MRFLQIFLMIYVGTLLGREAALPATSVVRVVRAEAGAPLHPAIHSTQTTLYAWVDDLRIRVGPGADSDVIGNLSEGEVANLTGRESACTTVVELRGQRLENIWVEIRLEDGATGWVHRAGLRAEGVVIRRYVPPGGASRDPAEQDSPVLFAGRPMSYWEDLLADENPDIREAAFDMVVGFGNAAIPLVITQLGSEDPIFRQKAVSALAGSRDCSVAPVLAERLTILAALSGDHTADQRMIVRALGELGATAAPAVTAVVRTSRAARSTDLLKDVLSTLVQIGPSASEEVIPGIVDLATREFPYWYHRDINQRALRQLAEYGGAAESAVPDLLEFLRATSTWGDRGMQPDGTGVDIGEAVKRTLRAIRGE